MNAEFFIDNKKYISAKRAAKLTGYATDYIGQLARNGKIDSKMIGRSWFVNEESLLGYKKDLLDAMFATENAPLKKTKKRRSARKSAAPKNTPFTAEESAPKLLPAGSSRIPELPGVRFISIAELEIELQTKAPFRMAAVPEESLPVQASDTPVEAPAPVPAAPTPALPAAKNFSPFASAFGGFLLGSAFMLFAAVVVPSLGVFYNATQAGAVALGGKVESTIASAEDTLGKSPLYFDAGVAAVGSSFDRSDDFANADAYARGMERNSSFVAGIGERWNDAMTSLALAVFNGGNSILSMILPGANVGSNLAARGTGAAPVRQGMAIVPSTGNAAEDGEVANYIKDSFSDDVKVVRQNDDGTGVIQPVFKSGKQEDYLYVLVPIPDGS
ncbi:MAG TPA: hypothetical protein VHF05_00505 [Candidatus Paceibacterota bacterium]|jgi:hypothetical protein|nr:hypothetical protein [Candidatus Paceibacterota bacterium]